MKGLSYLPSWHCFMDLFIEAINTWQLAACSYVQLLLIMAKLSLASQTLVMGVAELQM